jgi:hypothetical protein
VIGWSGQEKSLSRYFVFETSVPFVLAPESDLFLAPESDAPDLLPPSDDLSLAGDLSAVSEADPADFRA